MSLVGSIPIRSRHRFANLSLIVDRGDWFLSLDDAREKIEAWRQDYNRERPYGALGNLAPLEYASLVT